MDTDSNKALSGIRKFAARILARINALENSVIMIILCSLALAGVFRIIARNFLTSKWAIQLSDTISMMTPHLVLILGFYAASLGVSRGEVLKIDLGRFLFSSRNQVIISRIFHLVTAGILLVFFAVAIQSIALGEKIWIIAGYLPVIGVLILKSSVGVLLKND